MRRVHAIIRPAILALSILLVPQTGALAAAHGPSGMLGDGFSQAIANGRPVAAQTFILGAISQNPGSTQAIMSEAFTKAPQYADMFSRTVSESFPAFTDQVAAARSGAGFQASVPGPTPIVTSATRPTAVAQTNPAPARMAKAEADEDADFPPGDGWGGEIQVGGSHATGNTDTQELFVSASALYDGSRWHHELGASFNYSKDNNQVSSQRLVLDYEPRYDFTRSFYGFGFLEYRNDRFSGFNYELTQSLGVGYKLFDDDAFSWLLQAGPALRLSEDRVTGDVEAEYGALAQSDIEWNISDGASLTNETTMVFAKGRVTTTNLAALSMRIIGSIQGRLSFEVRHDSSPAAGTEATDTVTRATLVYGF